MKSPYKLTIKRHLKKPVYLQIAHALMEMIRVGTIKVGEKLLTERELSKELKVSRETISKAYEVLSLNSLIEVVQGSGFFVSEQKNYHEGERKGKAISILEKAIDDLCRLRFSPQEISTFFQLLLTKREENESEVHVLLLDCNMESLSLFEKQFYYLKNFKISKMLLSDFLKEEKVEELLEFYDLVLTTTTHFREIALKASSFRDRFFQCSLTLSSQTIIDFSEIPREAKIAVLCETRRFYDIVHRHLVEINISPENISYLSEKSDSETIKKTLFKKQVVICKPQSFGEKQTSMTAMGEFLTRGGSLVYFNYQLDRGILHQIEDRFNEIIKNKIEA